MNSILKPLLAALLLTSGTALAGADHDHDHANDEQIYQQIRMEQNRFFRQMQEDILNGVPVDVASGQCKYISSIFQPPPLKVIALTFDDGPSSTLTPRTLDILRKYGIKATFFMKGSAARANPEVVRRIRNEGHLVASHSYSHPNFHAISTSDQTSQITSTEAILGDNMPSNFKLFRYPYGNSTCHANSLMKQRMGYRGIVGWHVDSCDWAYSGSGYVSAKSATICGVAPSNRANFTGHVIQEVERRRGGIVLFHEIHQRTVDSLDGIIGQLINRGYKFSNLNDPGFANSMN